MSLMPWTAKLVLSLMISIPLAVVVSWIVIDILKLKDSKWPPTVLKSSLAISVFVFFLL